MILTLSLCIEFKRLPESLIRVCSLKPSKGADVLDGTGYRGWVGRIIGTWQQSQYQRREDENDCSVGTHTGVEYPTGYLV